MYNQIIKLFLVLLVYSSGVIAQEKITAISSFEEISTDQPKETVFLFDIDDTLIDHPYTVGSKGWRDHVRKYLAKTGQERGIFDQLTLFLARYYPISTVEPGTTAYIQNLQDQGHAVCGFTARDRNYWYYTPCEGIDVLTVNQLLSLGIDFTQGIFNITYPGLSQENEYFQGIFFSDVEEKGEYLKRIFPRADALPNKIVFIDDKLSQIESVADALEEMGIDYECYWYRATDVKSKKINPFLGDIQFYHYWMTNAEAILTDEEAAAYAEEYPDRDPDYYLIQLLSIFSSLDSNSA